MADTDVEQFGRAQSAALEPIAFLLCRKTARESWHLAAFTMRQAGKRLEQLAR